MNEHDLFKSIVREHLADRKTILKNAKKPVKERERPRFPRALAAAAAALVVLVVTLAAVPSARAAMLRIFTGEAFRVSDYLTQDPDSRAESPVPAIEHLSVPAEAGDARVLFVNPDYADAFADFSMTVEETFYDGSNIYVTGSIGGEGAVYLLAEYGIGRSLRLPANEQCARNHMEIPGDYDPAQPFWLLPETFLRGTVGTQQQSAPVMFEISWDELNRIQGYQPGDRPGEDPAVYERYETNARAYFAGGGRIRYAAEIEPPRGDSALSALADADGNLPLALTITVEYCDCGGEGSSPGKLCVAELGNLCVRLDAAKIEDHSVTVSAETTLSGTATVSHWKHDYEARVTTVENEEISLDGITLGVTALQLLPTTSNLVFSFDLPDTWTREFAEEFLRDSLSFDVRINGASLMQDERTAYWSGVSRTFDDGSALTGTITYEGLGLDPNSYAEIETVEVIPLIVYSVPLPDAAPGAFEFSVTAQRREENRMTLPLQ